MVMMSPAVRKNRATPCAMIRTWASLMTFATSQRSVIAPATGAKMTTGNMSAKAMMPSQAPEPVNSQVSQPTPTLRIQKPIREMMLPAA